MAVFPILAVKDYEASVKFYTEQLGFKSDFTMQGPDGSNVFGFISMDESVQIGLSRDTQLTERGNGVVLMLFPKDFDIDAYYAQVKNKGIPLAEELKTEYWGDRVFSVKDPDGYYLTFGKTVEVVSPEKIQEVMRQSK
jgi:uncharacterized glyoxalase superfamily protein PhnB